MHACGNITTQWRDERIQVFRKIYISLYLKGFKMVTKGFTVWEVGWRPNKDCNILTPELFWLLQPFFPFCWAAQSGAWGPPLLGDGSLYRILSPTNSNFLCYCFTPTQFNLSTVKVIPLIPSTGCTCYLHRCISYFDRSAGVKMQHLQTND